MAAEIDASYDPVGLDALVQQAFQGGEESPKRAGATPEALARSLEAGLGRSAMRPWKRPARIPRPWRPGVGRGHGGCPCFRAPAGHGAGGAGGTPAALEPLCRALRDPAVAVRRSAGDALNDLADPAAVPAMEAALADPNKLVRWRAARFLFELGGKDQLAALARAQDDPEFEVRMQVRQAMERIEGGQAAQGPVWMRMTQQRQG